MRATNRKWRLFEVALIVVFAPSSYPAAAANQGWEIDIHGGAMFATNPTDGRIAIPPPGTVIPPPVPGGLMVRPVPSWYFGDGALQLNQAPPSLRLGALMVPLDGVLQSRFVERRSGGSFGVRVSRAI